MKETLMRIRISAVVLAMSAMAVGCIPDAKVDSNETVGNLNLSPASQDFDPSNSVVPLPNILTLSPTTGRNSFPAQCAESASAAGIRTVLNQLDGSGTWKAPITVTFTEEVDLTSVEGHVFLYKLSATPSAAIPTVVSRYQTARYDAACAENNVVEGIAIVARQPLDDASLYTVAITSGIKSKTSGDEFIASSTFEFTSGENAPAAFTDANGDGIIQPQEVTSNRTPLDPWDANDANGNGTGDVIEQLQGLVQLYNANKPALDFLSAVGVERTDLVIAFAFKTETEELQLNPLAAKGPASLVDEGDLNVAAGTPITNPAFVAGFYGAVLGVNCGTGAGQLDCSKVGAIYGIPTGSPLGGTPATFSAQNYQVPGPNTGVLAGTVPGPWADAIDPPQATGPNTLRYYAFLPSAAAPADGYPVVVFGHGITRSGTDLAAISIQLASAGFASIAIDWPASGSRAVQKYPTAACASPSDPLTGGAPNPTISTACFEPILTVNLATTRDNVRQGVVDVLREIEVIKACSADPTLCGGFNVNAAKIAFIGQSLGTLIGAMDVAMSPDIKAAVLNVAGTSWLDILENTDSNGIKCPIVDALIVSGTITGTTCQLKADGTCTNADALCVNTDTTKPYAPVALPAYQAFAAAARWILDPADGVNFLDRMTGRVADGSLKLLVQQVQGDLVVPNESTAILAAFLGLTAENAATPSAIGVTITPSPTAADATKTKAFLNYVSGDVTSYAHGSLLAPVADSTGAGRTGTGQMQTDAITFLLTHLQ